MRRYLATILLSCEDQSKEDMISSAFSGHNSSLSQTYNVIEFYFSSLLLPNTVSSYCDF